jgi:hypothetical protein
MSLVARFGLKAVLLAVMAGGAIIFLAVPPLGMFPAAAAATDETPTAPGDTPAPMPSDAPPAADAPPSAPAPDAPPPADTTPAPSEAAPPPFPGARAPIPLAPSRSQVPVAAPPLPATSGAPAQPAFMAASEQLTTTAPTPVYGAPVASGPPRRVIPAGTRVQLAAKTADGQWAWLQTPDNQEAYVQMATLSARPAAPAVVLPDTLSGRVKVVTTARVVVDGHRIDLFGIRGQGGVYVGQMQAVIESRGGTLSCQRRGARYVCSLPGGIDIARAALYNGAARPAANASADYRELATGAKSARLGLWAR